MNERPLRLELYQQCGPYGLLHWYALRDFKLRWLARACESWQGHEEALRGYLREGLGRVIGGLTGPGAVDIHATIVKAWPAKAAIGGEPEQVATRRVGQLAHYLRVCQRGVDESATTADLLAALTWSYLFTKVDQDASITWMPPAELALLDAPASKVSELAGLPYPSLGCVDHGDRVLVERLLETGSLPDARSEHDVGHVQRPWRRLEASAVWDPRIRGEDRGGVPPNSRFSDAFYLNEEALYLSIAGGAARLVLCSPVCGVLLLLAGPSHEVSGAHLRQQPVSVGDAADGLAGAVEAAAGVLVDAWGSDVGTVVVTDTERHFNRTARSLLPAHTLKYVTGRRHFIDNLAFKRTRIQEEADPEILRDGFRLLYYIETAGQALVDRHFRLEQARMAGRSALDIVANVAGVPGGVSAHGGDLEAPIPPAYIAVLYELLQNAAEVGLSRCEAVRDRGLTSFLIETKARRAHLDAIVRRLAVPRSERRAKGLHHVASLLEHVRADARWVVGDDVVLASYSGAADEWTLTPPPAGDESEVLRLCVLVTGAHDARKEELGGA